VVDQFEELFRFERESGLDKPDEEAAAFVKLLLEAAKDKSGKIYIVITMRSDFLGDCARFRDLPEAINDGQYLIPRLTRNELRQVIESPAKVHGASISPGLVTYLLNEIGDDQDQLPVLQHALMRTWDHWENTGETNSEIGFEDYHSTGGMKEALSIHADEAFAELNESRQLIAEKLFKSITEIDGENRETRRATSLERICAIADAQIEEVVPVIEAFRAPGRTFLMPPHQVQLKPESLIDISHESLIRKWNRLHDWVDEEAESAQTYRRLAEDALLHSAGKAGFWSEPGLTNAVEWRQRFKPNSEWADLYYKSWGTRTLAPYKETLEYLDESKKVRDDEVAEEQRLKNRKVRRLTVYIALMSLMTIAMVVVAGWAVVVQNRASKANEDATNALVASYVESGRQELANNYPFRAAAYLSEAYKTKNDPTIQLLLARAMRSVETLESTLKHEDDVFSATFSPDGTKLLTAGDDDSARVWDLKTGNVDLELKHEDDVNAAEYSPDGKLIVTGSDDGTATIWESTSGKQRHRLIGSGETESFGDAIGAAKFSPDGKLVMVGSRNEVMIFDAETGSSVSTIQHVNSEREPQDRDTPELPFLRTADFSSNGDLFLTVNQDDTARVWDVESGRTKSVIKHGYEVLSAGFSADQKSLVTTSNSDVPKVWDVGTSRMLYSLDHVGTAKYAEFNANGDRVLSTDFGKVVKLSWVREKNSLELEHREKIRSVRFAPDGRTVVTIDVGNVARIWDAITGRILTSFEHQNDIYSARFSADGKKLATASADKTARVWTADRKSLVNLPDKGPEIRAAVFSKNGRELITTSFDNKVRFRNSSTGEVLKTIVEEGEVSRLAVSESGDRLLTTTVDGRKLNVWETESGKRVKRFDFDASESIVSATFSPEGDAILTATQNGNVALRDIGTGKVSNLLKGEKVRSASYSKDRTRIVVVGSANRSWIFDAQSFAEVSVIETKRPVETLDLSQDGEYAVFTGVEDDEAGIWSFETGKQVASLKSEDDIEN
ncbi:MAG: WD40 repeat domain-containing protein, partial [Pyrinomonadaceae bacterium]|nr:WD40 repeat domain-containing protein [Pyrinomonadaceae bacterium]